MVTCLKNDSSVHKQHKLFSVVLYISYFFLLLGCGNNFDKELGDNYGLNRHKRLLHIFHLDYPKAYNIVIPEPVDGLLYNDDWIVARYSTKFPLSKEDLKYERTNVVNVEEKDTTYYWIVDKHQLYEDSNDVFYYYDYDGLYTCVKQKWFRPKSVTGPLDFYHFCSLINELGINNLKECELK